MKTRTIARARTLIEAFDKAELLDLLAPIEIWIAIVQSLSRGTYVCAAWTENELIDKIASYCRQNWHRTATSHNHGRQPPDNNLSAIHAYFVHTDTLAFCGPVEMASKPVNGQTLVMAIKHEGETYAFAGTHGEVQADCADWCMRQLKLSHPNAYWSATLTDRGVIDLFFRTFRSSSTVAYNDGAKL